MNATVDHEEKKTVDPRVLAAVPGLYDALYGAVEALTDEGNKEWGVGNSFDGEAALNLAAAALDKAKLEGKTDI